MKKNKIPGPKARAIIKMDEEHTSRHYTRYVPLVVENAFMATITDVDGNKFLDFTAGIAVVNCGHTNPTIVSAIARQASKFTHMCSGDYYNEPCAILSKRLCKVWPGGSEAKVFFTNSGTEAVEGAIKLCRYVTGRPRLLAFLGSFHGRSCGSLSLTASKALQRKGFGAMLAGVDHAPYGDINYVKTLFAKTCPPEDCAAIFVEPLQGEGGYVPAPPFFLRQLRDLCDENGILLVVDEIQSGFGRTGKMFCIEHSEVEPDVMCLAKGIANGMPLGAVMAKKRLMDKLAPGCHGSTYAGNALALASGIASLDLIQSKYMRNANVVGQFVQDAGRRLMSDFPKIVRDVRGFGLMIGIEIWSHGKPNGKLRDAIVLNAFQKGLVLLGCGEAALRICPPLCLTKEEAFRGMEIIRAALSEACV